MEKQGKCCNNCRFLIIFKVSPQHSFFALRCNVSAVHEIEDPNKEPNTFYCDLYEEDED